MHDQVEPQFGPSSDDDGQASLRLEVAQQVAYEGLAGARRASGVARIAMGLHLSTLKETEGWRGRTGAKSFRRFLVEEGLEPAAAYQYMTVAKAFLIDHAILPERIAMVSIRLLVAASKYLHGGAEGSTGNAEEVVDIVTSMPPAEAAQALQERFEMNDQALHAQAQPRVSKPVANILHSMEGLTHDGRAELYQALRITGGADNHPGDPTEQHSPVKPTVRRRPDVIRPEPPPF